MSYRYCAYFHGCRKLNYKAGEKLGVPLKAETNGSEGGGNALTAEEIAACDGIIVAADKNVEMARFDGKPVLTVPVTEGIRHPEELINNIETVKHQSIMQVQMRKKQLLQVKVLVEASIST